MSSTPTVAARIATEARAALGQEAFDAEFRRGAAAELDELLSPPNTPA